MSGQGNEELTETEPRASGFQALGLIPPLVRSVAAVGYEAPSPIQAETIPVLLQGRDLLGQAQTGTGKTAAFALPLLQRIDLDCRQPQVLVLTPTRELAMQVSEAFQKYASELADFVSVPIYGGQDYQVQLRRLKAGVHIVVGTPGRVVDLMKRGALLSESMQALVLDEADEMLRMGFSEDVQWILSNFPESRQTALFSATLPLAIRQMAQQYLRDPVEVTIASRPTAAAESIEQRYLIAAPYQKQMALVRVLEAEPIDGVLVFVKTKSSTEPLAASLTKFGIKAAALNGDLAQKQRERIVSELKSGQIDVIVATDVAARGLDVQRISHVINYELPYDKEAYVHRIGRTGRAGRTGQAILFVDPREERLLHQIERFTRQKVAPMEIPSNRKINKQRVARFHEQITQAIASPELETYRSILEHYQRENDVPLELIAASLAVIANGGRSLLEKHEVKQAAFVDSKRSSPKRRVRGERKRNRGNAGMRTYRIQVGRQHRVQPGDIVGAIANETGIGADAIGRIRIFDRFSTVDLADEFPAAALEKLQQVCVSGRPLRISRLQERRPGGGRRNHSRNHK